MHIYQQIRLPLKMVIDSNYRQGRETEHKIINLLLSKRKFVMLLLGLFTKQMKLNEDKLAPNFNNNAACRHKRIMLAWYGQKVNFAKAL